MTAGLPDVSPRTSSALEAKITTGWVLIAGLADALVLTLILTKAVPVGLGMACHAGIAALIATSLVPQARDRTNAIVAALAILTLGPFGALAAVLLCAGTRDTSKDATRLEAWYRQLSADASPDTARAIHLAVVEGRGYQPRLSALPILQRIMAEGSVIQRQALLQIGSARTQ